MHKFKRVFLIIIDSLGIGASEDAFLFGDEGADTLGHISEEVKSLKIDTLANLGLSLLHPLKQYPFPTFTKGYAAVLKEKGCSKDTLSGHWEMMGVSVDVPFKVFTDTGFPEELLQELERQCGYKIIGNKSSSGTEILTELGEQAIAEKAMIVYTSADSVLQICGHEKHFGLEELYRCSEIARDITMKEEWRVGRIIARPFLGESKNDFYRTSNRKDYALNPLYDTDLDTLKKNNLDVIAIGKIEDIFSGNGITQSLHSSSSEHGMQQTIKMANTSFEGLCFVNLVDFDAKWGHRRDVIGYAKELESFDLNLKHLISCLKEEDLLMISADHGNDPTFKGSDHTRENVFLLAYSPSFMDSKVFEKQDSFGCIGASILENFNLQRDKKRVGVSLLKHMK